MGYKAKTAAIAVEAMQGAALLGGLFLGPAGVIAGAILGVAFTLAIGFLMQEIRLIIAEI